MERTTAFVPSPAPGPIVSGDVRVATNGPDWAFSDGEVHFLWWFIQGSIMVPETRWRLRRAWGFCDRHAWGALLGEAAFRHGYLHGPAVLYEDLMERALRAFERRGPWGARRVAWRLRETGPCLMCELNLRRAPRGAAREAMMKEGRDPRALRALAERTRPYWGPAVCGRCLDRQSPARCRVHFREDALDGRVDNVDEHRALAECILTHLGVYARSFVWGYHDTETDEDRAALISAVGWCSGWRGLMALMKGDA
jgi:hypothetical protein